MLCYGLHKREMFTGIAQEMLAASTTTWEQQFQSNQNIFTELSTNKYLLERHIVHFEINTTIPISDY